MRTGEVGEDEEGGVGFGGDEGEVLAGRGRAGDFHGEVEVHGLRQRHEQGSAAMPMRVGGGFLWLIPRNMSRLWTMHGVGV